MTLGSLQHIWQISDKVVMFWDEVFKEIGEITGQNMVKGPELAALNLNQGDNMKLHCKHCTDPLL